MAWLIIVAVFWLLALAISVRQLLFGRRLPLNKGTFLQCLPRTLWLPLPGRHDTLASEVVLILFVLIMAISYMFSFRSGGVVSSESFAFVFDIVALSLALLAVLLCFSCTLKQIGVRRYTKTHLRQTYVAGLLSVIQQANLPQRSCSIQHARSAIASLDSGFKQEATATPDVIADIAFNQNLRRVTLLPGLPEPEPVLASSKRRISNVVISIILAAIALGLSFFNGGLICLILGFFFLASGLLPLPPVRRVIRHFRRDSRGLIAGPGFAVGSKGQIWNTHDSVAIIRAAQLRPSRFSSVYLQLIGPAGCKQMSFGSISDPDFLCFWQRWTHSEPRPELAALLAADMLPS